MSKRETKVLGISQRLAGGPADTTLINTEKGGFMSETTVGRKAEEMLGGCLKVDGGASAEEGGRNLGAEQRNPRALSFCLPLTPSTLLPLPWCQLQGQLGSTSSRQPQPGLGTCWGTGRND